MAHAIEAHGALEAPAAGPAQAHCAACVAPVPEGHTGAPAGILERPRALLARWLNALNGTPVVDISRGDMGSIRRLAEA